MFPIDPAAAKRLVPSILFEEILPLVLIVGGVSSCYPNPRCTPETIANTKTSISLRTFLC